MEKPLWSDLGFWALIVAVASLGWQIWKEFIYANSIKAKIDVSIVKYGYGTKSFQDSFRVKFINIGQAKIVIKEVKLKALGSRVSHSDINGEDFVGKTIEPKDYLESHFPFSMFLPDHVYFLTFVTTDDLEFECRVLRS